MNKHIWAVVLLVGGYIGLQVIADIGATRLVQIGQFAIPGGTFVFALTFTWRDALHKRLGKEWARVAILTAAGINLFMAGYFAFISKLPAPVFVPVEYVEAWSAIFSFVPAIVIASITAEVISEWTDTEVYGRLVSRFRGRMQFMRVLLSNAVSLPLDSIIFGTLAFVLLPSLFGGNPLPWSALPAIILGQIVFKALVTVVSLPLIYVVPERELFTEYNFLDDQKEEVQGGEMGAIDVNIGDEI